MIDLPLADSTFDSLLHAKHFVDWFEQAESHTAWDTERHRIAVRILRAANRATIIDHDDPDPFIRRVADNPQIAVDLLAACKLCLAVLPGLEVRNWPPGFQMKRDAIAAAKDAIAKAGGA